MKRLKKLAVAVLVFGFVSFYVSPLIVSAVDNNSKTNICHATSSQNNPWEAIQISTSALQTHLGHGDFLYNGPLKQNGQPSNDGNNWCKGHAPAQISAAKVICDNEADLPNWGAGAANITAATVGSFLGTHPNCHEQPGWKFQWAPDGTANPGNNTEHAGGLWETFDENNLPEITPGHKVWVREEIPSGYITFSGATSNLNSTNAKNSAEFYCSTDVLNYDNYDSISTVEAGKLYHCVAFNVQIDVCPNLEGKQTTVPQGMHLNEDKQCVPDTATVHATKVMCDNEFDLPNWGNNGADIGPNTATDFVAGNSSCQIVPWTFQWAPDGTANPGNNLESAGEPWTSFSNGTAVVPAGNLVWLREQIPSAYQPFSGATTDLDGTDSKRSAEFYCSTDVLNYDNYDKITPVTANTDYYCVGFNTLKPTKADGKVHVFKYIDGVQATPEMTKTEEKPDGVSFPMYNAPYTQYPYYLGPYSDAQAGDIPYESSTYNIVGGQSYTTQEDLTTPLVGSSCSNENKPAYALDGYTTGKTLDEAKNGVKSLTVPEFVIDGDSYVIVWNKKCVDEVVDMCLNIDGIQAEVPKGYHADGQNCYQDENQCGDKELDVVSDDTNTVGEGNAVATWMHSGWTANIPGATWIWEAFKVLDPSVDTTKIFTKTFNIVGNPISATLDVAADNSYNVSVNANSNVFSDASENNFGSADSYNPLSYLTTGSNTISFEVKNWAYTGTNPDISDDEENPAGLLYKLHVVSNDCPVENENQPPVANAGPDQSINSSAVILDGSASTDSDGTIVTYTWTQLSGPTTIDPSDSSVSGANSLVNGVYVFQLVVTDNDGASSTPDTVSITVDLGDEVPVCPAGQHASGNECVPNPQCSDAVNNNDNDQLIDAADPDCHTDGNPDNSGSYDPNDDNENATPTITTSGGGGGGGGGGGFLKPQGQVLGAATSCDTITKYMRKGYKNDETEVKKLQKFLNDYMQAGLKEDGKFGATTEKALRKFQVKYPDTVLGPWGFNKSTGILYQTTLTQIKNIMCPDLKLPIPKLIPIEINPEAPAKI